MRGEEEPLDARMARLADGDRAAFAEVFELLRGPIDRLCLSLLKNDADAADAAQEAMQNIAELADSSAEGKIVQRDLIAAALAAVGELPESDRQTLVATFWDEAVSGATLRKRRERTLHRLRNTFRRLYGFD